jgi:DNA-binding NarL/FixJ family response regulator
MAVGIILLCVNTALWAFFFWRFSRHFSPNAILRGLREEADKLILENNRTTDRNITVLESRIRDLQAMIAEADRRMLHIAESASQIAPSESPQEKPPQTVRQRVAASADAGLSPEEIAYEVGLSLTEVQLYLAMSSAS